MRNHWNSLVSTLPLPTLHLGLPCALLAACISHKFRAILCETQAAKGWLWGWRGACGWWLLDAAVNSGRRCLFLPAKMCSKMLRRCLAGAFCAGRCWQGFGAAASFCQISLSTALRWYFLGGRGGFFAGCAAAWQNKCGCTVRRFVQGNPSCR